MWYCFTAIFRSVAMMLASFTLCSVLALAQSAPAPLSKNTDPLVTEEQNEAFRDTLVKMKIKREEEEHKKLVKKAEQIKANADALQKETSREKLRHEAEKLLKEIEKNAKNLRSESGGGGTDQQLDPVPASLDAALKQLVESSGKLHTAMEKTSRHVVSASVITHATDVLLLVKVLRSYLTQS